MITILPFRSLTDKSHTTSNPLPQLIKGILFGNYTIEPAYSCPPIPDFLLACFPKKENSRIRCQLTC